MDPLFEKLLDKGVIDDAGVEWAERHQREFGGALSTALLELDLVDEDEILTALEAAHGLVAVTAEELAELGPELAARFPPSFSHAFDLCPLRLSSPSLSVLVHQPLVPEALLELRELFGLEVEQRLNHAHGVIMARKRVYGGELDAQSASLEARLMRRRTHGDVRVLLQQLAQPRSFQDAAARVLRFANALVEFAVFVGLKGEQLRIAATGSGHSPPTSVALPDPDCSLAAAIGHGSYFLGPPGTGLADLRFFNSLERPRPYRAFVAPVPAARSLMFYADNGERGLPARRVAELTLVITRLGQQPALPMAVAAPGPGPSSVLPPAAHSMPPPAGASVAPPASQPSLAPVGDHAGTPSVPPAAGLPASVAPPAAADSTPAPQESVPPPGTGDTIEVHISAPPGPPSAPPAQPGVVELRLPEIDDLIAEPGQEAHLGLDSVAELDSELLALADPTGVPPPLTEPAAAPAASDGKNAAPAPVEAEAAVAPEAETTAEVGSADETTTTAATAAPIEAAATIAVEPVDEAAATAATAVTTAEPEPANEPELATQETSDAPASRVPPAAATDPNSGPAAPAPAATAPPLAIANITAEEWAALQRLRDAATAAGLGVGALVDNLLGERAPVPAPAPPVDSTAALMGEVRGLFERLATDIPAQMALGMQNAFQDIVPRLAASAPAPPAPMPAAAAAAAPTPSAAAAASIELVAQPAKPREVPSYRNRRRKAAKMKL
ncbi:MAG: hypothetical protein OEZ06_08425 [Myxococcales bacterium]|nr:hypothetical protein [Myxococcales bacterium]